MSNSDEDGDWLSEGCAVVSWNATVTVCRCTHLSVFAVIKDSYSVEVRRVSALSATVVKDWCNKKVNPFLSTHSSKMRAVTKGFDAPGWLTVSF